MPPSAEGGGPFAPRRVEDIPPLRKGHLFVHCTPSHMPIQEKPMAQAISFSCIQFSRPQRSMSAAALSAAVDSTKLQGTAPNSQAEPTPQKQPTPTPAALRERGVWGERRFSQRSGLSPQKLPYHSLFGRGPGGGASRREAASPGVFPIFTNFLGLFIFRSRGGQNWIVLYYT